jgi:hypothetical protein
MIIVYGTRMYGRIDRCGPTFLGTRFFHIWYVPLIPVGTHLVFNEEDDGFRGLPTGLSGRSVLAAYMRVWGVVGSILAVIALIGGISDAARTDDLGVMIVSALVYGFGALLALGFTLAGFLFIGKLSTEDKQRRAIYAQYTGTYADPADLGDARMEIRQQILGAFAHRAQGLASSGYRLPADAANQWANIAVDPGVHDTDLVMQGLTLARIDESLAQGPYKSQMQVLHRALWDKVRRLQPGVLQMAAQL